jgi:hypothetical protein
MILGKETLRKGLEGVRRRMVGVSFFERNFPAGYGTPGVPARQRR